MKKILSAVAVVLSLNVCCAFPTYAQSQKEKEAAQMVEALIKKDREQKADEQKEFERRLEGGMSKRQAAEVWTNLFWMLGVAVAFVVGREIYRYASAPKLMTREEVLDKHFGSYEEYAPEHKIAMTEIEAGKGESYLLALAEEGKLLMMKIALAGAQLKGSPTEEEVKTACRKKYMELSGVSEGDHIPSYVLNKLGFAIGPGKQFQEKVIEQWFYFNLGAYHLDAKMKRLGISDPIRLGYEHRIHKGKAGKNIRYLRGKELKLEKEDKELSLDKKDIPFAKDRELGERFLQRAVKAAEDSVDMLRPQLMWDSLRESFKALVSSGTPWIFELCTNVPAKRTEGPNWLAIDLIRGHKSDYPKLNELFDEGERQMQAEKTLSEERKAARAAAKAAKAAAIENLPIERNESS